MLRHFVMAAVVVLVTAASSWAADGCCCCCGMVESSAPAVASTPRRSYSYDPSMQTYSSGGSYGYRTYNRGYRYGGPAYLNATSKARGF